MLAIQILSCRISNCIKCSYSVIADNNRKKLKAGYWDNNENLMKFLEEIQKKLNLQTQEDWNKLTRREIEKYGGRTIFTRLSMYEVKCLGYPQGKSFFTDKNKPGYWDDENNVKEFLISLGKKLNLKNANDWNSITRKQIELNGGGPFIQKYSMNEIKCLAFPDGKLIYNPENKPAGFWENSENILRFIEDLREKYNLKTAKDWNSISSKQIIKLGGGYLLQKKSLYELKCLGFPEGKKLFKPAKYWDKRENILKFIDEIREKLNLKTAEDWNSLTTRQIINELGGSCLIFQNCSLYDFKCIAFPDGKDIFDKPIKPPRYWNKKENILNFIDEFRKKLNLKTFDDWNSISYDDIKNCGGVTLFNSYSLNDIKRLGFPEGKEKFTKIIKRKSKKYWEDSTNIRNFLDKLQKEHNLKSVKDWKRISKSQIAALGGNGLLARFKNEGENVNNRASRSSQRWLFIQLQKIFFNEEIVEDYYHSELSRITGYPVQFDVFLVNRNIAFEYHGAQHYEDIPSGFGSFELCKRRDEEKEKLCKEFGIQLLIIPHWWDNKIDSLKKTICDKIDSVNIN